MCCRLGMAAYNSYKKLILIAYQCSACEWSMEIRLSDDVADYPGWDFRARLSDPNGSATSPASTVTAWLNLWSVVDVVSHETVEWSMQGFQSQPQILSCVRAWILDFILVTQCRHWRPLQPRLGHRYRGTPRFARRSRPATVPYGIWLPTIKLPRLLSFAPSPANTSLTLPDGPVRP